MEEDAGKNVHGLGDVSVVDLNRAGTPLIEIVGEPDLRSAAEAAEYLRVREILVFIGVNDGNLEQGTFRCDANVCCAPREEKLGARAWSSRTSTRSVSSSAPSRTRSRARAGCSTGPAIAQETRGWNEDDGTTFSLRSKEEAHDYRYFPDPDLPPLVLDDALVERVRSVLPELPQQLMERLEREHRLSAYDAAVISAEREDARAFEGLVGAPEFQPRPPPTG